MNPNYGIIMWIIVGGFGGWLAGRFMGTAKEHTTLGNIALGIVGAIVGGFIARSLLGDSPANNGFIASTAVATLGACLIIWLRRLLEGKRAKN